MKMFVAVVLMLFVAHSSAFTERDSGEKETCSGSMTCDYHNQGEQDGVCSSTHWLVKGLLIEHKVDKEHCVCPDGQECQVSGDPECTGIHWLKYCVQYSRCTCPTVPPTDPPTDPPTEPPTDPPAATTADAPGATTPGGPPDTTAF